MSIHRLVSVNYLNKNPTKHVGLVNSGHHHQNITNYFHDIAEKLLIWRLTTTRITQSITHSKVMFVQELTQSFVYRMVCISRDCIYKELDGILRIPVW